MGACDVKKATFLHKICVTHSMKKGQRPVKDTRSAEQRCWFPLKQTSGPKPFSKDGVADWRTMNGASHGLAKHGTRGMIDPFWGCATTGKRESCSTSKYGTVAYWYLGLGL